MTKPDNKGLKDIWIFHSLIRNFNVVTLKLLTLGKFQIYLDFRSLIRNFNVVTLKLLTLGKFQIYLDFRSLIRNFAA